MTVLQLATARGNKEMIRMLIHRGAETNDAGAIDKLNSLRFKYVALAPTRDIAGAVARQLGVSKGEVVSHAAAGIFPNSLVLFTAGRSRSPERRRRWSASGKPTRRRPRS